VHLFGFIIRIYYDARSSECQIHAGRIHLRKAQLLPVIKAGSNMTGTDLCVVELSTLKTDTCK
jgi:hypothetical protein